MDAEEEDAIIKDITELEGGLVQQVSFCSLSLETVINRVKKQSAIPFAEHTLAKCREFEETGRSCFREHALQNIIFSSPTSNSVAKSVGKHGKHTFRSSNSKFRSLCNHNLQTKGSGSRDKQQYLGMTRDLLPNDVCSDSSRAMPGGSRKRKRSEKDVFESKLKPKAKASKLAEPGSRYMEPKDAASDSPRMQLKS